MSTQQAIEELWNLGEALQGLTMYSSDADNLVVLEWAREQLLHHLEMLDNLLGQEALDVQDTGVDYNI